jgi:methyl-accepting chemotaxis protein
MFPSSFNARVAERMAIWCAMVGFLLFLYAATEFIQAIRMSEISDDRQRATAAMASYVGADATLGRIAGAAGSAGQAVLAADVDAMLASLALSEAHGIDDAVRNLARETRSRFDEFKRATAATQAQAPEVALAAAIEKRAELGRAIVGALEAINDRQGDLFASQRQNKLLIVLLAIFVVAQILFLEHRWLVKPIVRMAAVLRTGEHSWRELIAYAWRRDEIGAFAQALISHFSLARQQREMASDQQAKLSERLSRQEDFKRESMSFQDRIAEIVQGLEGHAGRMSEASGNLFSISSEADARAGASAQSTQRVSDRVDVVAASIRTIATTLTVVVEDAEKTSAVAAAARNLVEAARDDVKALTEAVRTIEPVIGLIQDVASQTNLLALNATIEAARAGEMGRGFGVVAHEVKQLASRTSRATEDVRDSLHRITGASGRIAERVARLVESIEQVDGVAAAIASSMRNQDANSQTITANTAKAADDVREVAETVKHVATMIAEARQAADLVTKSSAGLGQQAADLRSAVERFIETTEGIAA